MLSAAWIWIAADLSPLLASMIVGGALLGLAVCIAAYTMVRRARLSQKSHAALPVPALAHFATQTAGDLNYKSVLLVAGLGYVAGRLMFRR